MTSTDKGDVDRLCYSGCSYGAVTHHLWSSIRHSASRRRRSHFTLYLLLMLLRVSQRVCLCVLAPYTSEEEDDDVNPREKKQVGWRISAAVAVAASYAPSSTLMT